MEIQEIVGLLKTCLEEFGKDPSIKQFSGGTFSTWKWKVKSILINGLKENAWLVVKQWDTVTMALPLPDTVIDPGYQRGMFARRFEEKLLSVETTLQNIIWQLEAFGTPYASSKEKGTHPKAFIAHGPKSSSLEKLCRFLTTLGVKPIIIEEEPSEGRSIDQQVEMYLEQADCAIVCGTADDKELKDGKLYPRRNVCIEIGRFQERFSGKIIYLLEEGASLPSNVSEKIHERFTQVCMEEAFVKVIRELTAFGLITSFKPEETPS